MDQPPHNPARQVRLRCRSGALTTPTAGLAPGHVQANLLILPSAAAADFRALCARNPVPCPLLGSTPPSATGDPTRLALAAPAPAPTPTPDLDLDLRTDLPLYNVYRAGRLVAQPRDLRREWTPDHVAFLIGCSFSFDAALARAGLPPRHWETAAGGRNVPMYKTSRRLNPAGIFTGSCYVVSMRPYRPEQVDRVRHVTRPFERMHGEPVAWGWEGVAELGIGDLGKPDFGEPVEMREGEVPVFWGCGVTPQVAVVEAGHKIEGTVMAHAPGHMLVLDMTEEDVLKSQQL